MLYEPCYTFSVDEYFTKCGVDVWYHDISPARLVNELLKPSFDLIVGEEGHVPRVSNCQAVPVPQQG